MSRHLDLEGIGELCALVGVAGYRPLVGAFFEDASGSVAALRNGLEHADLLGLRGLAGLAGRIEHDAEGWDAAACWQALEDWEHAWHLAADLCKKLEYTH